MINVWKYGIPGIFFLLFDGLVNNADAFATMLRDWLVQYEVHLVHCTGSLNTVTLG